MKRFSLLVHTPGIPLSPEDLVPQRVMAAAAATLLACGHETRVIDCGSLEHLQRMATPSLRAQARRVIDGADDAVLWEPAAVGRAKHEAGRLRPLLEYARQQRNEFLLSEIAGQGRLDFVAFMARDGDGAAECLGAAAMIRAAHPDLKLVLFGPFAEACGVLALDASRCLDAVVTGETETSLPAWAAVCDDAARWKNVPGLLFRDGAHLCETPPEFTEDLASLPQAAYDADTYPGLKGTGKIKVYTIEMSRGLPRPGYNAPLLPGLTPLVRAKRPATLHKELMAVHETTGARAFHFSGRGAPSALQDGLAVLLTTHPFDILYSRSAAVARLDPARLPLLAASGCCAIDFQADTGSQRLLEDFYGNDFSVTLLEGALRACRNSGFYTAVHLTFPCPQDDRHTQAETLRIINRCRPDAVSIRAPRIVPGSSWCARAPEFGFRIAHRRYARWTKAMLGGARPMPRIEKNRLSAAELALSYRMSGWSEVRAAQARTELLDEIQDLGVTPMGSAALGLMARLAGHDGEEGAFILDLARALFTFDVETAASLTARINANAIIPKNTYELRPFQPMLAAVAN